MSPILSAEEVKVDGPTIVCLYGPVVQFAQPGAGQAAASVVARHRLKNAARRRARWTRLRDNAVARAPARETCRFSGVIAEITGPLPCNSFSLQGFTRMRGRVLADRGAAANNVVLSVRGSRRGLARRRQYEQNAAP